MNGINLIKDYIKDKKEIVVFCGAGLSVNLGLPNWKDLTVSIITKISDDYGMQKLKTMIPPLENDLLPIIDVLEFVSDKIYLKSVHDIIKDKLEIKTHDYSLHEAIIKLSKKIVTTNYDVAFENLTDNKIRNFTSKDNISLANISDLESYLFKVHGDISKPESCLIFKRDYESLYDTEITNYFIEIAKLFTNKILLFIGFSLNDPYIVKMFDKISDAYKGYTDKHFIITTEESKYDKYREYLVPLKISDHSELKSLLDELNFYKASSLIKEENDSSIPIFSNSANIQICIPRPINKIIDYNSEIIASSFMNFNIKLIDTYFNIEKLPFAEDVDYIFIFSQVIKGQIIIEDESLKFKLIKLSDINIVNNGKLKGVFLFVYSETGDNILVRDLRSVSLPIVIIPITLRKTKEILSAVIYKVFTKADKDMLGQSYEIINPNDLILTRIKKGTFRRQKQNTFISKFIDKKNLVKFVGRRSDQENIVRKILSMRYENKLLSIKGSGGIGKTSIISKVAIELAERGYFEKGIYFITCNPIQSFENFEFELSQCFNLTSSKFLRDQINDTIFVKDRIIILDNFETLLNIEDSKKILDLVSFICDYSIVVVTTRQILDLDFEEIYELRNLTTDEGVELFKGLYNSHIPELQEKILRRDIVEKLLNNNPLAIKLIVKGLPASKNFMSLKEELEENFFNQDDIDEIFESKEDYNIERSASLYHSINYSYRNLNNSEKLAFEVLSLFPDGMHMENFKSFCKASKDKENKIGDREIKQLDNKSLLENANGFLKLQSIISRFSDYQFKQRSENARIEYYKMAYAYNKFFIDLMDSTSDLRGSIGLKILDLNTNNYLKSLEYLNMIDLEQHEKISYISKISNIFRDTNQPNEFLDFIENKEYKFDKEAQSTLTLVIEHLIYWTKDFERPLKYIKSNYPFDKLSKLKPSNILDKIIIDRVLAMYKAEGYDFNILKIYIFNFINKYNPSDILFKLGYLQESHLLVPEDHNNKTYFDFEIEMANNQLDIQDVVRYMNSLYKKESLEMTQMTYLKSKLIVVSNDEIKKLVISNPYTRGLIFLMHAKNESDTIKKMDLFHKAKQSLFHIKYHYVECIIELLKFLKQEKISNEYSSNWNEAVVISKKHYFRNLLYKLNGLEGKSEGIIFDSEYYPIPIDYEQVNKYIQENLEKNKSYFKMKSVRVKKNVSSLNEDFG